MSGQERDSSTHISEPRVTSVVSRSRHEIESKVREEREWNEFQRRQREKELEEKVEKKNAEITYEEDMRMRLRRLGYKQNQIDTMVRGEEQKKKKKTKTTTPPIASKTDVVEQEPYLPCKSSTISSDATRNCEEQNRMLLKRALGKPQSFQAFSNSATEPSLTSTEGDSYWGRVETSRTFLRNLGLHTNRPAPGAPPSHPDTGFTPSRTIGPGIKGSNDFTEDDKEQDGSVPYPEPRGDFACDECHMRFGKLDDLRRHGQGHEKGHLFCPFDHCANIDDGFRSRDELRRHAWLSHGIVSQDLDDALAKHTWISTNRAHKVRQEL